MGSWVAMGGWFCSPWAWVAVGLWVLLVVGLVCVVGWCWCWCWCWCWWVGVGVGGCGVSSGLSLLLLVASDGYLAMICSISSNLAGFGF